MVCDDPSVRLRKSIVLNDLPLVRRMLRSHPRLLYNPDFTSKSDTSLHIAARLGLVSVAEYLIQLGHDSQALSTDKTGDDVSYNQGISINTDGHTPLHLASAALHTSTVRLLCMHFPSTVNRRDKEGRSPLLLAAEAQTRSITPTSTPTSYSKPVARAAEDISTLEVLLECGADVLTRDIRGNSCLHYACAFGNLKAIRLLIHAGADSSCMNYEGWKPELYSLTVQAEVYYRNLVTEFGNRMAEEHRALRNRKRTGGLRIVDQDEEAEGEGDGDDSERDVEDTDSDVYDVFGNRSRADSGRSQSTFQTARS